MGQVCIWQVAASLSTKDRYPAPKCHHITQPENKNKDNMMPSNAPTTRKHTIGNKSESNNKIFKFKLETL